ncbi:MAG: sigma-54 dependent transcriptional regulator [Bacteroidales bacterium]|nr:sigma-54 dependent transcriptional regulator [Bacteroidales bacterium]
MKIMDVSDVKRRFEIIGNSPLLDHAIKVAIQVAPTDLTVLISGESGVGKEVFPKIIHSLSARKHGQYTAVNCGAIPEGTIDSELFGHEKGSFTGATEMRKGYFEVASGGTIFLDEVAELPLSTQVRLLRVLESGEFMKVGSSKTQKTDVRVVAASNVNIPEAIQRGRFREDLYYRLNTVPIHVPALRDRKDDIYLLFRKFAYDFAERYKMPAISLDDDAQEVLTNYRWNGNVRQLKNITEQISIIEQNREIDSTTLLRYLPENTEIGLPVLFHGNTQDSAISERDLLYKVLFEMRQDISDLKRVIADLTSGTEIHVNHPTQNVLPHTIDDPSYPLVQQDVYISTPETPINHEDVPESTVIEESFSIKKKEQELIEQALNKHKGRRKAAADELGLSERTLYRKIKEYGLDQ